MDQAGTLERLNPLTSGPSHGAGPSSRHRASLPRLDGPRTSYWELAQRPLPSLLLLLPLIVLYEVGTALYITDPRSGMARYIYARSLLVDFFQGLGLAGLHLPALLVAAILLGVHVTRKDSWRVHPGVCFWMGVESLALALPLFVFAVVLFRLPVAPAAMIGQAATAETARWQEQIVFSLGAGIYEELLFRLISIAVVHMLLVDVLRLRPKWGDAAAIVISAILFSLYHFSDANPYQVEKALFYFAAGLYFAGVFMIRGFGITAASHAMYDVLVVLLKLT
ncbi:MAG: CPBP family intramembrane metalloprotease [Phycisphaeraceae bacterium]|nr:CPBP family intramembrane metalloprotease [Phycisphaeraceae bacterium]